MVSASLMRKVHLGLLIFWLTIGMVVSFVLRQSVAWVVALSVYAIVATHWAGWSAERPDEG
jgi:hypothetical protein